MVCLKRISPRGDLLCFLVGVIRHILKVLSGKRGHSPPVKGGSFPIVLQFYLLGFALGVPHDFVGISHLVLKAGGQEE